MDEIIQKAANINYIADNMIAKIKETRDQYDVAQAMTDASSMIFKIEQTSRQKLGSMNNELNQKVTEFLGALV